MIQHPLREGFEPVEVGGREHHCEGQRHDDREDGEPELSEDSSQNFGHREGRGFSRF